jgi:hypothetical protein
MTRRIVIFALAALLATAAGALAHVPADPVTPAASKPPPRLSRAALAAAQPGCQRYADAVRPYLYGAGADDLRKQIRAFRSARARLSSDLRSAITRARDRRLSRLLVTSLHRNGLLSGALARLDAGRIEAAYKTLSRWDRQTAREQRVARRIGLRRCMDPGRGA